MRICYVVQRYGRLIAGGAEQHCREMAERMAARGHHVEVATTCAESYVDWANAFEPGTSEIAGVIVHRFPVRQMRFNQLFNEYNRRMTTGRGPRPLPLEREWMRLQGPESPELASWLLRNRNRFDCVICFTYLYWPTAVAATELAGLVPLVMHPTVHDEPPLRLSVFDEVFHAPDAFALSTPEEITLIERRFGMTPPGAVIGIGVAMPDVDDSLFRRTSTVGSGPYLLYVGRIDEGKGARELLEFFVAFKEHQPGDLKLVMLGEPLIDIPVRDDIVVTGFVDYDVRDSAMAGALALVNPSFFESFSMVLTESFAHRRPALVQGRCEVLRGHALRSGAAIPYEGFAEFAAGVELLLEDPARADAMGAAGRAYVEREYDWEVVLDRYERLLDRTVREWSALATSR
ncbi:MAG TPA: glycosyltransferase family 4 protein [Acidimicrobiia bacterium]|jgi:glycosyltransferase involved in cell wall biosynthesis|nr:glycosyltransferase family 4 protein [Acidimicrobiia bacterium]